MEVTQKHRRDRKNYRRKRCNQKELPLHDHTLSLTAFVNFSSVISFVVEIFVCFLSSLLPTFFLVIFHCLENGD